MDRLYIGIDLGTDSLGFAATDENYKVLKFKGKRIIGTRLFDEAQTGAERRMFRTNVRRTARRKERVKLLQGLFAEEICKIDFEFFTRLSESKYHLEDRTLKQPNTVFNDENYKDIDYHNEYPTIYHLRKALVEEENKKFDVRLVYLAIEHMMKNRGHFLFDSIGENGNVEFTEIYDELTECLYEKYGLTLDCDDIDKFKSIISDRTKGKSAKESELTQYLKLDKKKDKQLCNIIGIVCGAKKKLKDIFDSDKYSDSSIPSISFSEAFDDKEDELRNILDEDYDLIEHAKAIYDWSVLSVILNGKKYISQAKCEIYYKHEKDLHDLKDIVKKHFPHDKYKEVFRESKKNKNGEVICNYVAYSGTNEINHEKSDIVGRCTQLDFCKYVAKLLENVNDESDTVLKRVKQEAENGTFMPKQTGKDNSIIPYQVNLFELKKILANASKYLDFLSQTDESGLSVSDKIIKIFEFRIPYYVGPLNENSERAWLERKEGKIFPWNFNDIVDVDKSAEKFITNLTNKCTYLRTEDVLPKNSLLYSKYSVLNELNNLKTDGEKINVELKQDIFENLFMRYKRVTFKSLVKYLISKGVLSSTSKGEEISGIDGDFKSNLSPYIDFRQILEKYKDEQMVEEIIKSIVLFGDDRKLLKNRIVKRYGDILTKADIDYVCKLRYRDWGRLSRKLLDGICHVDKSTGEVFTIIEMMYRTNENLMQLLSNKYDFVKEIEKANDFKTDSTLDQMIEDMYISPSVKRPVYQTIAVINETVKIIKKAGLKKTPDKIFIEMTRKDGTKNDRKLSRKKQLEQLYANCKKESKELYNEFKKTDEKEFKRDKLYLYYTQKGRCMYSGEQISLDELYTAKYDIDHIFPQSKIKDDSIDNRVLVKREENAQKGNKYPISNGVRDKMLSYWKMLKEQKFISQKKYDRLTRTHDFTDDELNDFVARQLVQTNQSTKAVCELLKTIYPKSAIVYSKASNVSDFRHEMSKTMIKEEDVERVKGYFDEISYEEKAINGVVKNVPIGYNYDFIKCREVNDYHHAKDAYLNIVVGNVYDEQFTRNKANFIQNLRDNKVSVNKLFSFDRKGAWTAGFDGSIATVKKELARNDILFTRYCTEKHGKFYDQMIVKSGQGQAPIKANDEKLSIMSGTGKNDKGYKYGGYNKVAATYFCCVEFDDKNGKSRTIFPIDLYKKELYERNPEEYCKNEFGIENPKVLVKKIKINTLMKVNGYYMHLSGKSNGGATLLCKNAVQLCLDPKLCAYVKKLSKFNDKYQANNKKITVDEIFDGISKEMNYFLYSTLNNKLENSIYNKKFSKLHELMSDEEKFTSLSVENQVVILIEFIKSLQCNSVYGNLKMIGGPSSAGILTLSSKIMPSKNDEIKLIYQSPTGLFEQEIDLLADEVKPKKRR